MHHGEDNAPTLDVGSGAAQGKPLGHLQREHVAYPFLGCEVGSVLDVEITILDKQSKGVPIDEQANDDVVQLRRFREADRLTDQALNACPQRLVRAVFWHR